MVIPNGYIIQINQVQIMDTGFWLEKWQKGEIGFHLGKVNPLLEKYWALVDHVQGHVFVPLCGKSRDMAWLAQLGRNVVGVELSPLAVDAFFVEAGWQAEIVRQGALARHAAHQGQVIVWQGDFFELTSAHVAGCSLVYDRAALIALPARLRQRYVEHLRDLLPTGTQILLVTLEYPQTEMRGPPFSVEEPEVHALYGGWAQIERVVARDVLKENERFRQRGVSDLKEVVYRICKEA